MSLFPRPLEALYRGMTVAAGVVALGIAPSVSFAADRANSLQSIEQRLEDTKKREDELSRQATEAQASLARLRQRSIAIAARTQEHEATILMLEDKLNGLEARKREKAGALEARRAQLAGMLAALQRIAMHPPVALIALPMKPVDTVRSALLLRDTVPAVDALARELRDDLDALDELARAVVAARNKIEKERAALRERRKALAELTEQKAKLVRTTRHALSEEQKRAERLGKQAHDLRDLIARLARRPGRKHPLPTARPDRPVTALPKGGKMLPSLATDGLPVRGRIDRQFGDRDQFGEHSRGVLLRTPPASTVVAPRDGEVVFAGPFRGLGHLLIIEYQAKYHLLLAGLARIDTQVGEKVLAGEPIGVMQSSEGRDTTLYMELRRNGQPINPLPWLAAGRTRVNG